MKKFLILALLALALSGSAQQIKLIEGDLKFLKGQSSINIQLTFDDLSVGKFDNEQDYVTQKKADYNSKENGKGDVWEKAWFDDRESRFKPRFVEMFTERTSMSKQADAPYTLIFNTIFIEPGFNVGIARKNAFINGEVFLVDTKNINQVLAKISITNAPGRIAGGFDYDTGLRIQEAYAMAGREIGKFISKMIK